MGSRFYTKRLRVRAEKKRRPHARPKSFSNEESAKKWAEAQGIKNYTVRNLRHSDDQKLVVVKQ